MGILVALKHILPQIHWLTKETIFRHDRQHISKFKKIERRNALKPDSVSAATLT